MHWDLVKNNLRTKATMKNLTNQLLKVNLMNHGRENAQQKGKETEIHTCHLPPGKLNLK